MRTTNLKYGLMALSLGLTSVINSCSDDDPKPTPPLDESKANFVIISGDAEKDLSGGAYVRAFSDLSNTSRRDVQVYGDDANAHKSLLGYTQCSYNSSTGLFMAYNYRTPRYAHRYTLSGTTLTKGDSIQLDMFNNTGTYSRYAYAAQTTSKVMRISSSDNTLLYLDVSKFDATSVPTITGIVEHGSNQLAVALDFADQDSFAVAFTNYDLQVTKLIKSAKAGHSSAKRKSIIYNQLVADDAGNLYAFGGTATDASKVGAAMIRKNTTEFDRNYFFDIFAKNGGHRIRKVFHITDDKFLLEYYTSAEAEALGGTGSYAIADMSDQTLTPVTGLPTNISGCHIGWGDNYNGKFYLPVSTGSGLINSRRGGTHTEVSKVIPTIYAIDARTGQASVFITLKNTEMIKGFKVIPPSAR